MQQRCNDDIKEKYRPHGWGVIEAWRHTQQSVSDKTQLSFHTSAIVLGSHFWGVLEGVLVSQISQFHRANIPVSQIQRTNIPISHFQRTNICPTTINQWNQYPRFLMDIPISQFQRSNIPEKITNISISQIGLTPPYFYLSSTRSRGREVPIPPRILFNIFINIFRNIDKIRANGTSGPCSSKQRNEVWQPNS